MKIKITTAHSQNKHKAIEVQMNGSAPMFGFIWIDDILYTIRKNQNGSVFTISKVKED